VASIQFNSDMSIHSNDGVAISKSINTPGEVLPDNQRGNHHIRVHTGGLTTYQQHDGVATQGNATTRVQLHTPDGKVQIGKYRTDAASAENLKAMSPELFVTPEVKAAEAAKATDAAREDEATREELGRHADDALESYHQHLVGEVSPQALIGLMVYGQRNETPPADLLRTIADQMGEPLGTAVDKVNAVIGGVHRQFTNLATAFGVNPEAAAVWLKEHRKDTSMACAQAHMLRRDVRTWLPLLEDYRSATGDGIKH
jgi:hypothetical protein